MKPITFILLILILTITSECQSAKDYLESINRELYKISGILYEIKENIQHIIENHEQAPGKTAYAGQTVFFSENNNVIHNKHLSSYTTPVASLEDIDKDKESEFNSSIEGSSHNEARNKSSDSSERKFKEPSFYKIFIQPCPDGRPKSSRGLCTRS